MEFLCISWVDFPHIYAATKTQLDARKTTDSQRSTDIYSSILCSGQGLGSGVHKVSEGQNPQLGPGNVGDKIPKNLVIVCNSEITMSDRNQKN